MIEESNLPWPIDGLAYVATFMGPMSAGLFGGILTCRWLGGTVGLLLGICLSFLNGWVSDRFVDSWIAKHQRLLQRGMLRVLVNIIAFAWAVALSGISMLAPLVLFGDRLFFA